MEYYPGSWPDECLPWMSEGGFSIKTICLAYPYNTITISEKSKCLWESMSLSNELEGLVAGFKAHALFDPFE